MEDFAQFYLAGLADLLDALIHMAFWKLAAGLVLFTIWALILSALPDEYRGSVRAAALAAIGLTALAAMLAPLDWETLLR